jgi:hypothetical protein
MGNDDERRSMSSSFPTGAGVPRREYEDLKDEMQVTQNQFNLVVGFVVGVFVGVIWEVLRRR